MKRMNEAHCVILPMVWVGEKYVVEPNGWVDKGYVDPAFSLLPVQPPKVNPLSLPCSKDNLTPVGHKLSKITGHVQAIQVYKTFCVDTFSKDGGEKRRHAKNFPPQHPSTLTPIVLHIYPITSISYLFVSGYKRNVLF